MPGINRAFPHLLSPDIAVWQRFLEIHGTEYDYFDYDIRVGRGQDPGPQRTRNGRQQTLTPTRPPGALTPRTARQRVPFSLRLITTILIACGAVPSSAGGRFG